jgi:hypothetical protein
MTLYEVAKEISGRLIQLFGSAGPAEMLHGQPLPLARPYQPPEIP